MDGVIAIFWTDLDPGKVTDCPQTHHCGGGGNVYYKKDSDHLVGSMCSRVSHLLRAFFSHSLSARAPSYRRLSTQQCNRGHGTISTTSRTQGRPSKPSSGMAAMYCSSTLTC